MAVVISTAKKWTVETVEALVIDLLADLLGKGHDELQSELVAKGSAMPVDSLDLLDILQEFRLRMGLRMPVRKLRRDTMRSVRAFAEFAVAEGWT